jgi:late competence protein required for DNA uptake (superfamily II DNA/RNA helicase)
MFVINGKIERGCIRCHKTFKYKINMLDQRGSRTRKYCNHCIILNHSDESREYQRIKRAKLK